MWEITKILTNGNILIVDGCDCSFVEKISVNEQRNEKIELAKKWSNIETGFEQMRKWIRHRVIFHHHKIGLKTSLFSFVYNLIL